MRFPDRLPIPDEVLKIAQKLEDAGYETWCVGGAIRDNLLGLENHDFDLTTAAPPEEVRTPSESTISGATVRSSGARGRVGWKCLRASSGGAVVGGAAAACRCLAASRRHAAG